MHRILLFIIFLMTAATCDAQVVDFSESELPIFVISTNDQTIVDEPKITAHLGVINNLTGINKPEDDFNEYDGAIGIEIRGNGSKDDPKKSYLIETRKPDGSNNNVTLLDFPKENDWILYSPYTDKSLLRNVLTYHIANEMGQYASRTKPCELIINGDYKGVYVLLEKIKRDDNRIDVLPYTFESQLPSDNGYIFKIDAGWYEEPGWEGLTYQEDGDEKNTRYHYVYPKKEDVTEAQKQYLQSLTDEFELSLTRSTTVELDSNLKRLIDVPSFVDFLIINELAKNPDAYRLSTYMHKDAEEKNSRIKMGPVWDFNFGYGNYWGYENKYDGWEFDNHWWQFPDYIPNWWEILMENKEFISLLHDRWHMWRSSLIDCVNLNALIDKWVVDLHAAPQRNFERWDILELDLGPGWHVGSTYEEEIEYLQRWLCNRIDWLDNNIEELYKYYTEVNINIFPNPTQDIINLRYNSDLDQKVNIHIYNSQGALIYTEKVNLVLGPNEMQIDLDVSKSGVYILTLFNDKIRQTSKVVLHK